MKPILKFIIPVLLIVMTGCTGGAGKFVGKWRVVKGLGNKDLVMIAKKGDHYEMYPEKHPDNFMPFIYDSEHDMLTATQEGQFFDIKYDKDTKHLKAAPRGGGGIGDPEMEMEKAD